MTPALPSGIHALRDAVHRARLDGRARFAPVPRDVFATIAPHLPLTEDLRAWYEADAPHDARIPQFPEDLELYDPRVLVERQEGYRWSAGQRGVVLPQWDHHWLVIGDYSSDPVIAHTNEAGTPVSLAAHGQGSWEPYRVAPTLAAYLSALAVWLDVSVTDFDGAIRDDDSFILPAFRAALDAKLAPVLTHEYRRHWLFLEELRLQ